MGEGAPANCRHSLWRLCPQLLLVSQGAGAKAGHSQGPRKAMPSSHAPRVCMSANWRFHSSTTSIGLAKVLGLAGTHAAAAAPLLMRSRPFNAACNSWIPWHSIAEGVVFRPSHSNVSVAPCRALQLLQEAGRQGRSPLSAWATHVVSASGHAQPLVLSPAAGNCRRETPPSAGDQEPAQCIQRLHEYHCMRRRCMRSADLRQDLD